MSTQPSATPAAPERTGVAERLAAAAPALLLLAAAAIALMAVRGIDSWWVAGVAIPLFGGAVALLSRERAHGRQLRRNNRALTDSDRRYRHLYENAAAAVLTLSADGRARAANPAMLRLLGCGSDAELRRTDFAQQTYAGPGTFDALLQRARTEGELPIVEMHLRGVDGRSLMTAATVRALWDEAGAVTGYEVTLLDIGDLKLAERQRRSVERRFRRLFDSNAVGILFGNLQRGTMDEANERLRQMVGLRASELPVLLDSMVAGSGPSLSDGIRAALENDGHSPPLEADYLRADGTSLPVLVCAAVVDPLQSEFVGVVIERPVGTTPTVTEAAAHSLYGSLLDALPVLVARFNSAEQLTYCNEAYRAWFGFPAAPLGWSLKELIGADSHRALAAAWNQAIAGASAGATIEVLQAGGRLRALEVTLVPHRRADGSTGGCIALMSDRRPQRTEGHGPEAVPMPAENTYSMECR